jgi:hypothetical protein
VRIEEICKSLGETRNINIYFEKIENTYRKTRKCVKTNKRGGYYCLRPDQESDK